MQDVLKMTKRDALGKISVKKLRGEGVVPAVVYGKKSGSTSVQLTESDLVSYFEQGGRIADLQLDGEKIKAVVKEVQHDVFTDRILHVDFQIVSMTEKLRLPVPVILTGELQIPPDQGVLEHIITEVEVECLPDDAPEKLTIDISEMKTGDSLHISDLTLPQGVVMITATEDTLATVRRPAEEVEAPVEEEEVQEPEVIGESKKEEEESTGS